MLVVNDDLVAVSKRVPGHVVGDGKSTVSELVDQVNSDPRRGVGHEKVLTRLELVNPAYLPPASSVLAEALSLLGRSEFWERNN